MDLSAVAVGALAVVGAGIGGLITYLGLRRQNSGQVGTSDASTLWEAAKEMRKELRDEVVALRAQAVVLLAKIDSLEQRLADYEKAANGE